MMECTARCTKDDVESGTLIAAWTEVETIK